LRLAEGGGIVKLVERGRFQDFASWDREDIEDQRRRQRTVSLEQRLEETIAWSAALLADELEHASERGVHTVTPPDPVGLGTRRT
jgi:hypothetical protein